jgi:hypothetical protein
MNSGTIVYSESTKVWKRILDSGQVYEDPSQDLQNQRFADCVKAAKKRTGKSSVTLDEVYSEMTKDSERNEVSNG